MQRRTSSPSRASINSLTFSLVLNNNESLSETQPQTPQTPPQDTINTTNNYKNHQQQKHLAQTSPKQKNSDQSSSTVNFNLNYKRSSRLLRANRCNSHSTTTSQNSFTSTTTRNSLTNYRIPNVHYLSSSRTMMANRSTVGGSSIKSNAAAIR